MQITCISLILVAMCCFLLVGNFVATFFIALLGLTFAMVAIGEVLCSLGADA